MRTENIEVFHNAYQEREHIVTLQLQTREVKINIINIYCQPSKPIEHTLETLELIITKIKQNNEKLVIAMDANAKSHLWNSNTTDERGTTLEEFIISNDLNIINEESSINTFSSSNGSSIIHICDTCM